MKAVAALLMMLASTVSGISITGPEIITFRRGLNGGTHKLDRVSVDGNVKSIPFGSNGELVNIPSVMLKEYYYPVDGLPDRTVIQLHCGSNHDNVGCEFFVNVYHCPGCSNAINGGLPGSMTAAGHQGGSCAPGFTDPDLSGKFVQPMVAFRVLVEAGEYVPLPELVNDAKHIAIFGSFFDDSCKYRSLSNCDEPGCSVEDGKCVNAHFCQKTTGPRPQGPDARMCPRNCLSTPKEPVDPVMLIDPSGGR
eukprot:TRINITY_DN158_c0_g1_i1.p1 TRINITY_DN158_c0_g1~~TRINITY_DN158_c0_g1_i1.p1  ORF type:complete len:271 (+),score=44.30 TRINITY_DN158_c0_g1_i1:65-814(+)